MILSRLNDDFELFPVGALAFTEYGGEGVALGRQAPVQPARSNFSLRFAKVAKRIVGQRASCLQR